MSTFKYYKNGQWNVVSGEITGDTLPIGSMIPYGSTTAPTNWLICDGSAISRTEYSELFEVIGTSYGAGDGSTTFNLPNYKGRVPVGYDSSQTEFNTLGKTGGSKYMQQHNHPLTSSGEYVMYWAGSSGNVGASTPGNNMGGYNNKYTQNAGTGDSGNLQPYQVSCFIIKAKQSSGYVGNIANTYSTSQTDTYSCDYINDSDSYSTTEVKTNKRWIDGKPIYRCVFNSTTPSTNDSDETLFNISHLDTAISLQGILIRSNGQNVPVNLYYNSSYNTAFYIDGSGDVRCKANGYTSTNVKLIIEYTKTN